MAHREFRDSSGRAWAVWSVHPGRAERRNAAAPAPDAVVERRKRAEFRVPLSDGFAHGWLCFETKGEKRRLSPFPANWANMSDSELEELSKTARKAAAGRRLVE
jgi:hypothetical protein